MDTISPPFRVILTDFRPLRPRYESRQEYAYQWLAAAHEKADPSLSRDRSLRLLQRFGCDPTRIRARGHELPDFLHTRWDEMLIYDLSRSPSGKGLGERTRYFVERVTEAFRKFYDTEESPPDDLIHITCTGYALPSSPQRLVNEKSWHTRTRVTHLYHMGCYAAIPAIRTAGAYLAASHATSGVFAGVKNRVDLVHTELCSLHLNPALTEPRDLVAQSLFADGMIRYSSISEEAFSGHRSAGLEILAVRERISPNSLDAMSWIPQDWGMEMRLDRKIPELVTAELRRFFDDLFEAAELRFNDERASATFAVHPGGPKIVDLAEQLLELRPTQVRHSHEVLRDCGNMSSATLPHIWSRIIDDPAIRDGQIVASVAFGPGLTICGAVLRKIA